MAKKTYTRAIVLALAFSIIIPSFADAQSRRSSRTESRSWGSQYSSKIKALDKGVVEDLPVPILFGVTLKQIFPNFGDDRDGGARSHMGLDIMAPKGAPIISPTDAVVTRVGDGENSGETVTTANPGGESFVYMHLSEISVKAGQVLKKGDLIGYVGNTGNASGGAPHLHLEIRDEDREAMDPFPRITLELSLKDKISYLEDAIKAADDEDEFVEFIAETYPGELQRARAAGIELPDEIVDELPAVAPVTPSLPTYASASGDLELGSQGPLVITLQEALIAKDSGPAAKALKSVGATGYFGTITQNALIEYQQKNGIVPAAGYYGPKTRAHILGTQ